MPGQLHYGVTDKSRRCYRSVSGALRVCSWANTKLSSLRRQPEASQIGSRDSPLDLGLDSLNGRDGGVFVRNPMYSNTPILSRTIFQKATASIPIVRGVRARN